MFTFFHHELFRRYLLAFGSFFDSMEIHREVAGEEAQRIQVPLDYSPKERWLTRLVQDPELKKGVSQVLPRMAYDMTSMNYDAHRKLKTMESLRFPSVEQTKLARMYVGVPYNLSFDLSVLTKTQEDGFQLVEQILPHFTPDLTFRIQTVPELGIYDQIPLTLNSVHHSDNYEGNFETRRAILWNFSFTMKVFFYGPVRSQERITEVIVDLYATSGDLTAEPSELLQETGDQLVTEDATGHLLDEVTDDIYQETGRVARITATADPNQEPVPGPNVQSTTVITEWDGNVKHDRTLTDEEV